MTYRRSDFDELPGWDDDDHEEALAAFRRSFAHLKTAFPDLPAPEGIGARHYFETFFVPHQVVPFLRMVRITDTFL